MELDVHYANECRRLYRDIGHLLRRTGEVTPPGFNLRRMAPGGELTVVRGAGFKTPVRRPFGKVVYLEELRHPLRREPIMGVNFGDRWPTEQGFGTRFSYAVSPTSIILLARQANKLQGWSVSPDTRRDMQTVLGKLKDPDRKFGPIWLLIKG